MCVCVFLNIPLITIERSNNGNIYAKKQSASLGTCVCVCVCKQNKERSVSEESIRYARSSISRELFIFSIIS
jgi:hypothetical protein